MPAESRAHISDPAALEALAHPVRLDVLSFLMDSGPATASVCARAVGDSPSNCSWHLRVLARHGLVERAESEDGRERPWRALVTGIAPDPEADDPGAEASRLALAEASIRLDARLAEEHLRTRHLLDPEWREADAQGDYGLRVTAAELRDIVARVDAIVRPYIAATRDEAPDDARIAHFSFLAFPRTRFDGPRHDEQGPPS